MDSVPALGLRTTCAADTGTMVYRRYCCSLQDACQCVATTHYTKRGESSSVVSQEAGERIHGVGLKLFGVFGRFGQGGGRIGGAEGVEGGGLRFRLRRRYKYIGLKIRATAAFQPRRVRGRIERDSRRGTHGASLTMGLLCMGVPMTHNARTFTSSEGEGSRPTTPPTCRAFRDLSKRCESFADVAFESDNRTTSMPRALPFESLMFSMSRVQWTRKSIQTVPTRDTY